MEQLRHPQRHNVPFHLTGSVAAESLATHGGDRQTRWRCGRPRVSWNIAFPREGSSTGRVRQRQCGRGHKGWAASGSRGRWPRQPPPEAEEPDPTRSVTKPAASSSGSVTTMAVPTPITPVGWWVESHVTATNGFRLTAPEVSLAAGSVPSRNPSQRRETHHGRRRQGKQQDRRPRRQG